MFEVRGGRGSIVRNEGQSLEKSQVSSFEFEAESAWRAAGPEATCAKRTQSLDCGLRIGDCGLGTNLPLHARAGRLCETKPILPHRPTAAMGGLVVHKQTQFAAGGHGRPSPRPEALTLPPTGDKRAKQSQFRQSDLKGQVLCGKRVMTNGTHPGRRQNKANFRPSGGRAGSGIRRRAPATPRSAARSLRLDVVKPRRYFKWLVWSLWDARASGDSAGSGPARWWTARKSNLIIPARDAVPNQG